MGFFHPVPHPFWRRAQSGYIFTYAFAIGDRHRGLCDLDDDEAWGGHTNGIITCLSIITFMPQLLRRLFWLCSCVAEDAAAGAMQNGWQLDSPNSHVP